MKVLAVGCHPDDLEIGCGGTLALYAEKGHEVFMCHVANGDMGHAVILPGELAEIRTAEAESSGQVLGAKKIFNLNFPTFSAIFGTALSVLSTTLLLINYFGNK